MVDENLNLVEYYHSSNLAVDGDQMSTENQAISVTEGLDKDKDANISRVTLPATLKYEDEETIKIVQLVIPKDSTKKV
mgnify:CR=1 FL=1